MSNVISEVKKTDWLGVCNNEQDLENFVTSVFGETQHTITQSNRRLRFLDDTCNAVIGVSNSLSGTSWYLTLGLFDETNDAFALTYSLTTPYNVGIVLYEIGTIRIYVINNAYTMVIGNVVDGQNGVYTGDGSFYIRTNRYYFANYNTGTDLREPYMFPGIFSGIQSKKAFIHSKLGNSMCFAKHEGKVCFIIGNVVLFP